MDEKKADCRGKKLPEVGVTVVVIVVVLVINVPVVAKKIQE